MWNSGLPASCYFGLGRRHPVILVPGTAGVLFRNLRNVELRSAGILLFWSPAAAIYRLVPAAAAIAAWSLLPQRLPPGSLPRLQPNCKAWLKMPKRLADDQLLLFQGRKKAKFTVTGKPICDQCHNVIYEGQCSIMDRYRHVKCWPAYLEQLERWRATLLSAPMMPRGQYKIFQQATKAALVSTLQQLKDKECIMRQVNCVSRGVRDAMMYRDRAKWTICLALALVKY